jgi:carbonic anhydrase/acetyltransferase-like protein (isoleucine patch superfamily)
MPIYQLDNIAPEIPNDEFTWIAPTAVLLGKVVLKKNANIWFGAVLRGDNEAITIAEGSNVQENCILHTDMGFPLKVEAGCTIGHKAMLHGCTVGDNSLIGMGAIVLNGARIGRDCLIGAGALVTEGKVIPDGSLVVGSPAKVVRALDADTINMLKGSALSYQEKMARYRSGLRKV